MRKNRLLKAIAAGFLIGLAAIGTIYYPAYKAVIFPAGLLMVVLTQSELFTGKILLLAEPKKGTAKYLALCYVCNFYGSLIASGFAYLCGLPTADLTAKLSLSPIELVCRGIFCNVLVCLAVWLAGKSDRITDKAIVVYACISLFVLCGYEHCIADMTYLLIGALQGSVTAFQFINVILFSTVGNIIGGIGVAFCISEEENESLCCMGRRL